MRVHVRFAPIVVKTPTKHPCNLGVRVHGTTPIHLPAPTMIARSLFTLVALLSVFSAACYPVAEPPRGRPRPIAGSNPPAAPQTAPEIRPERPIPAMPQAGTPAGAVVAAPASPQPPAVKPSPTVRPPSPSPAPKPQGPVTAEKAQGRKGYVLSPYTGKLILVEGIPSGVVVPDQTCPPGEKKFFRVP
jgi:hypothetical protein